jgi:GntR family transcriptional regulator, transcriptional repressor for pyruvate dehydrogenase complex
MTTINGTSAQARRTLGDGVFDDLFAQIIGDEVAVGAALLPERALAEKHGVNRQVVREAVKRLEQLGLVSCGQGDGNRVRDWRETGGFDLLPMLISHSIAVPSDLADRLARSLLEMRMAIGTDAARLAALRIEDTLASTLRELGVRMANARTAAERAALSSQFWSVLIDASGNIAYRLHYNTITNASNEVAQLIGSVLLPSAGDADGYRRLAAAIAAGDPSAAAEAASVLLRQRMPDRLVAMETVGV